MRYTVVDNRGAVSFVAACDALPILVAACAENPPRVEDLLSLASRYQPALEDYVTCGMAIFDEHNVDGRYDCIHNALKFCPPYDTPVFRVVDARTREASLQPVKAGIVIFNLRARRIVQVQNSYAEVQRRGKVIVRDGVGRPRVYRYQLPDSWVIVP
jgi:hypothetical protein